jgi:outer membrane receptor protein involved in Fe transport
MGLSYKMYVGEDGHSLNVRLNVNNVMDNVYINELRTNIAAGDGNGVLYDGIDTANQGYFGMGRTWNVGLRYRF